MSSFHSNLFFFNQSIIPFNVTEEKKNILNFESMWEGGGRERGKGRIQKEKMSENFMKNYQGGGL